MNWLEERAEEIRESRGTLEALRGLRSMGFAASADYQSCEECGEPLYLVTEVLMLRGRPHRNCFHLHADATYECFEGVRAPYRASDRPRLIEALEAVFDAAHEKAKEKRRAL